MRKTGSKALLSTEIVAGILSNIPEDKERLPAELRKIHPIFYELYNQGLELVKLFSFDSRGTFPYSYTLDQALSNLETARILPRPNPDNDEYFIGQNLRQYYKKRIEPRLTDTQVDEMKKLAERLSEIAN